MALTVSLSSFSFKKKKSASAGDHGGGFVFDCRCLKNPGREEKFKKLTGKDPAVRRYLDALPQRMTFEKNAFALVLQAVRAYRARGFSDLSVEFGCTGGRHRSVYFAEKLAVRLRKMKGVRVRLRHRHLPRRKR